MIRAWAITILAIFPVPIPETVAVEDELAEQLRKFSPLVLSESERESAREMVRRELRNRMVEANRSSSEAWSEIDSRDQWEAFSRPRIEKLKHSLGVFPNPPEKMRSRITGEIEGDGFRIRNLVFESRPGLWVTANLYLPADPAASMPGIILCHSHHRPKEHGELQDMGMTWARAGCAVLVPDQLGHGERRQHPFVSAEDFPKEFRVSRQDYYFRYDTAIQLHLVGDSLIGWMVWDLMRGVDYLLGLPEIDPEKIILLGAVAGGGDPAAVAAAIDDRIAAAVPFNFGGPQPETRYPLPDDVEASFNYAGSGGWESTRNLRRSAADGFLPWVIVGGIAPCRLIFAHEFNWDRPRDPVWKRLQAIYGFYEKPENLAFTHGKGELRGRPPEASHCTHIGKYHRQLIHPAFEKWFGIRVTAEDEFSDRRDATELRCLTSEVGETLKAKRLVDLLPELAQGRAAAARTDSGEESRSARREVLRRKLSNVLGRVEPPEDIPKILTKSEFSLIVTSGFSTQKSRLKVEPEIVIPFVILRSLPPGPVEPHPVVVAIAQSGKEEFLARRANEIASLLANGIFVCLPDLRGTGETREGGSRGRRSADTGLSSSELMLGGTMAGARLRDLRSVIRHLGMQEDIDISRLGIWGDSFAVVNPQDRQISMPRGIDGWPDQSEPLGGMLALLVGLYEPDVKAVYINGGLGNFRSVLNSQFVLIPHDVVVPGMLEVADLPDIAASLPPGSVRIDNLVDESNRRLSDENIRELYPGAEIGGSELFTDWMASILKKSPE